MKNKPREIRWAIYCLIILIVMNAASLLVLLAQNEEIARELITSIQNTVPSLSAESLKTLVSDILVNRNLFHLFVIVCWSILTYTIYKGKNWGRVLLIFFTLLSFVGSIYAFSTTQFMFLQIMAVLGWIGRVILLWLLLVPSASREYFRTSRMIGGIGG